jgi:hypothetical protein
MLTSATLKVTAPLSSQKSYIGKHIINLTVTDGNNALAGVFSFTLNIVDCVTVWLPSSTLTKQTYTLGAPTYSIEVPAFSSAGCYQLTTSYTATNPSPSLGIALVLN